MKHTGDYELDEINMLEQECQDLEEDNKRLEEENRKLREKIEKLEKELSAVYKAYHTAMWVDYNNEEDLYTIEDIEWHNAE